MKVSVLMMAYNHASFIAQAVESVLMQETNFAVEVVIGDDSSKDGTQHILTALLEKYPGRVKLLLNDVNMGMHRNFAQLFSACQGEFIALLEGDDYWTSPQKLQKQVDFLEQRPDFSVSFHDVLKISADSILPPVHYVPEGQKEVTRAEDLLAGNFIPTCSIVFRRSALGQMPTWTETLPMLDWALLILLAERGKIGYLPAEMGVYRTHPGGVWSSLHYLRKLTGSIQFLSALKAHPGSVPVESIEKQLSVFWQVVSKELYDRVEQAPSVDEAIQRIDAEVHGFPKSIPYPKPLLRKLYAQIYAAYGFRYFNRREHAKTRYCWKHALINDFSWIKNRGVWSIYLKSLLAYQ